MLFDVNFLNKNKNKDLTRLLSVCKQSVTVFFFADKLAAVISEKAEAGKEKKKKKERKKIIYFHQLIDNISLTSASKKKKKKKKKCIKTEEFSQTNYFENIFFSGVCLCFNETKLQICI